MADYITMDEARRFVELPEGTDEMELRAAVQAATQSCIDLMNWDVSEATVTEKFSGLNGRMLPLARQPVTAVTSVLVNGLAVDLSDIDFDSTILYRRSTVFPKGIRNITVTYTGGYDPIPTPVKRAVLYTLKAMWDARGTDQNMTSEAYTGVSSGAFWPSGPGYVPPQAQALMNNYMCRFKQ